MAKRRQYTRPTPLKTPKTKSKHDGPLLSIAIIFKNEIRCLERCLKSLQPLRDAIPCQLVMADTGSDDGSREIAEQYADVLFDFPWIHDFAAARNAVLDRCTGAWTLSVDCDEWLDDPAELITFLRNPPPEMTAADVVIRNYKSADLESAYVDFVALRLLRMRDRPRYQGAIHETPIFPDKDVKLYALIKTILRHDGYLDMNSEDGKAKRARNLPLIRKALDEEPDNLMRILQYAESGYDAPDFLKTLKHGMEVTERKQDQWNSVGPAIFSYAIQYALSHNLYEWEEWIEKAEELFPESYRVRLDLNALRCIRAYNIKDYKESIRWGEDYLKALSDFDSDNRALQESQVTSFPFQTEISQQSIRIAIAHGYFLSGRTKDALETLRSIEMGKLAKGYLRPAIHMLADMHRDLEEDFAPFLITLWDSLLKPLSMDESAEERKQIFMQTGAEILRDSVHEEAGAQSDGTVFHRPAYTLFLPLAGTCPPGDWAKMMTLEDPDALSERLARQDVAEIPAPVLLHALSHGAEFPVPGQPLTPETVGTVCESLRTEKDGLISLALERARTDFTSDFQSLLWTECLLFAALSVCDWTADEHRYELFRAFAAAERAFVSRYYTPEAIETACVMLGRHRAGWQCAQAVEALDAGDFAACVRYLRGALEQDKRMAQVTEFMLNVVSREERKADTSPELLEMAERTRQLLASLDPDAPEVKQMKESPVYQSLAWLIED